MAGTRKAPAKKKAEERIVHAESLNLEVARVGSKWFVSHKTRGDTEVREMTVEEAAALVARRLASFTHHWGLKGGEQFDALVDSYGI